MPWTLARRIPVRGRGPPPIKTILSPSLYLPRVASFLRSSM